jgi:dTDP-4-dehydrorhamnose reductase
MRESFKILVTGGNGQLGSEIKSLIGVNENYFFHDVDALDITNYEALSIFVKANKISFIVNCAAFTAVDKAEQEQDKATLINQIAVQNIRRIAEENDLFIIHVSTDYVFDGTKSTPYNEEDETNPQSVYGMTKLMGERELLGYSKALTIRTSWLYSSYGHNFVKTILKYGKERESLNVVFDQIGSPTYARELAKAIIQVIDKTQQSTANFKSGIYHFSNEGVCSWYDFALEICEIAGLTCQINPIETKDYPLPAKRPFYSVLNKAKIKQQYSVSIPHWKESLRACMQKIEN